MINVGGMFNPLSPASVRSMRRDRRRTWTAGLAIILSNRPGMMTAARIQISVRTVSVIRAGSHCGGQPRVGEHDTRRRPLSRALRCAAAATIGLGRQRLAGAVAAAALGPAGTTGRQPGASGPAATAPHAPKSSTPVPRPACQSGRLAGVLPAEPSRAVPCRAVRRCMHRIVRTAAT